MAGTGSEQPAFSSGNPRVASSCDAKCDAISASAHKAALEAPPNDAAGQVAALAQRLAKFPQAQREALLTLLGGLPPQ